jgi:predicted outer membrane repeat protein
MSWGGEFITMVWLWLVGCGPLGEEPLDVRQGSARMLEPGCKGSPYSTIQAALDDARDGDVIEVCPGTYPEPLVVEGKALTLRSREGAAQTVVDAQGLGPTLSVSGGAELTVQGLTLRGGVSPGNGGNLYCSSSALWLEDSLLQDGQATTGGALGASTCHGHVIGNTFEGNEAWAGGAAWVHGDELAFEGNAFVSNHADGAGGAIYLYGSSPLASNLFRDNDASLHGGALYLDQSSSVVDGNRFLGNLSWGEGGALYVFAGAPRAEGNRFVSNHAGARGGALYAADTVLELSSTVLRSNTAVAGGGVYLERTRGQLHQLLLLRNEAAAGPALTVFEGELELYNSVLGWNVGAEALEMLSGEVWVRYNDFFHNVGPVPEGNLSVAPGFTSLEDGDYTLSPTSPLRDAGHPDVPDEDGTRSDIGLYGG